MQPRYIRSTLVDRNSTDADSTLTAAGRTRDKNSEKRKPAQKPSAKPVEFRLNLPGAKSATVAGSFNDWDLNRTPLSRDPNGGWKTTVLLKPGRYEYRFVIDGAQWYSDPGAAECVPNGYGSTNSVVVV